MPLVMPKPSEYEAAPSGTHIAVCYRVIDLGTQTGGFAGEMTKRHKILVGWELAHEAMADGRPFSVSRRYTLSSHRKSQLRIDLEAWRGRAFTEDEFGTFDLGAILGKGCLLGIVHEQRGEQTYANVTGIMALPKGQQVPPARNPLVYFALDSFDPAVYAGLSDGLREVIARAPEYQRLQQGQQRSVPDMSAPAVIAQGQDAAGDVWGAPPVVQRPVFATIMAEIYGEGVKKGYSKEEVDRWLKNGATALQCSSVDVVPLSALEQWRKKIREWPEKLAKPTPPTQPSLLGEEDAEPMGVERPPMQDDESVPY